jgi:hypothetical protein
MSALANLKASLDRVRDIALDIDASAQAAMANPLVQARHATTLCAACVILSGFLESFLREIAEEIITEICSRAIPFDTLPENVRVTHYWDGSICLREGARQDKKENPIVLGRSRDVARRLASVANPTYEIIWEAFAETQANPGPNEIGAFLKRFDIANPLPTLAAAMNTTQNNLVLRLRSFLEIRNECAHTGTATNVPTTTDVQGYCDLIEQLGTGVDAVFQNLLTNPPYI